MSTSPRSRKGTPIKPSAYDAPVASLPSPTSGSDEPDGFFSPRVVEGTEGQMEADSMDERDLMGMSMRMSGDGMGNNPTAAQLKNSLGSSRSIVDIEPTQVTYYPQPGKELNPVFARAPSPPVESTRTFAYSRPSRVAGVEMEPSEGIQVAPGAFEELGLGSPPQEVDEDHVQRPVMGGPRPTMQKKLVLPVAGAKVNTRSSPVNNGGRITMYGAFDDFEEVEAVRLPPVIAVPPRRQSRPSVNRVPVGDRRSSYAASNGGSAYGATIAAQPQYRDVEDEHADAGSHSREGRAPVDRGSRSGTGYDVSGYMLAPHQSAQRNKPKELEGLPHEAWEHHLDAAQHQEQRHAVQQRESGAPAKIQVPSGGPQRKLSKSPTLHYDRSSHNHGQVNGVVKSPQNQKGRVGVSSRLSTRSHQIAQARGPRSPDSAESSESDELPVHALPPRKKDFPQRRSGAPGRLQPDEDEDSMDMENYITNLPSPSARGPSQAVRVSQASKSRTNDRGDRSRSNADSRSTNCPTLNGIRQVRDSRPGMDGRGGGRGGSQGGGQVEAQQRDREPRNKLAPRRGHGESYDDSSGEEQTPTEGKGARAAERGKRGAERGGSRDAAQHRERDLKNKLAPRNGHTDNDDDKSEKDPTPTRHKGSTTGRDSQIGRSGERGRGGRGGTGTVGMPGRGSSKGMRTPNQEGAETERERIEQELRQLDRKHERQDERGRHEIAERQKVDGGREKARTRAMDEERKGLRRQDKMERTKREAREDFAQVKREGEKERRMQRKKETEGKERMQQEADEKRERRQRLTQEARGMRLRNNDIGDETRPSQNDYSRRAQGMGDGSDDEEESFATQYNLEDYRKKAQQYAMMKLGGLGSNVGSDEHMAAKQKADRMRDLAKRVNEANRERQKKAAKRGIMAGPLPTTPHAADEVAIERRRKMQDFSKNVPKPKAKVKVEVEPTASPPKKSRGGGGAHFTTTFKSLSPAREERRFTNKENESKGTTRKLPQSSNLRRAPVAHGGDVDSDSEKDVRDAPPVASDYMGAADEEESEDELEGLDLMNKKNAQARAQVAALRAEMGM